MSSQLKISADTSEVKKSILDLSGAFKNIKGSKVQIFSTEDKKFIKGEMKKEIALMKQKLKENASEIKKMVDTQKTMVQGTKEELELRKKILDAYKTQTNLGKQLGQTQSAAKSGGDVDKGGGEGMLSKIGSGLLSFARMIPGIAAVATVGYALKKGYEANAQYVAGAPNRNRLKGLGVQEENFGSSKELARVGLTEQEMIQRRIEATSRLGREGTSNETEMRKAGFERAFGLQGGTMTNVATQLRGEMGGKGANEAQLKMQAAVFSSGIEDALAPYLESMTSLLSQINESGTTNTDEITNLLAQLTKSGERTPELLNKAFGGIDSAMKGATGEQSAFLQTAFARAGIGGGTIGGTKFALSSGGLFGMNKEELLKRGYNKELVSNMENQGMFKGVGERTEAITGMMNQVGGLKPGESVKDITDTDRQIGLSNVANSIFGTKGNQGFDALMMLEDVKNKKMTQQQFESKLKDLKEGKDPSVERLDKINDTLSGQTVYLRNISDYASEQLGKEAVVASNALVKADIEGIKGIKNVGQAINSTGVVEGAGNAAQKTGEAINSGSMGSWLYDKTTRAGRNADKKFMESTSDQAIIDKAKQRRDEGTGFKGWTDSQIEARVKEVSAQQMKDAAKAIGAETANAMKPLVKEPIIKNNIKVQSPGTKTTERTN